MTVTARLNRFGRFAQHHSDRLQARINRLAFSRFLLFIGLVIGVSNLSAQTRWWALLFSLLTGGLFIWFMVLHDRLYRIAERMKALSEWVADSQKRCDLNLADLPERAFEKNHPFAQDCDLAGAQGLWKLIDQTHHHKAAQVLLDWLAQNDRATTQDRQDVIREGACRPVQALRILLTARLGKQDDDAAALFPQCQIGYPFFVNGVWVVLLTLFALFNAAVLFCTFVLNKPIFPWQVSASIQFFLYLGQAGFFHARLNPLLKARAHLTQLRLSLAEIQRSKRATLQAQQQPTGLLDPEFLKQLQLAEALTDRLEQKKNAFGHFLLNYFFQIELWTLLSIRRIPSGFWIQCQNHKLWLYQWEAMCSLILFAAHNPDFCWPELTDQKTFLIRGKAMGHPLIKAHKRITNDFQLSGPGQIVLITGSNMSGKSTFLRTLGVNTVLARMGLPTCCQAFSCSLPELWSSLRIADDLSAGISTFYAEVRRLRAVVAALEKSEIPVFYLLDEILRGTNSRERLIAVKALVRYLTQASGSGLITTHDLELLALAKQFPEQVVQYHFQEQIEAGQMGFDYQLRPGALTSTNALHILEGESFPFKFNFEEA